MSKLVAKHLHKAVAMSDAEINAYVKNIENGSAPL